MDVLRTAVSALAAFDPEAADNSAAATLRKGIRLTSQVPMVDRRARAHPQRARARCRRTPPSGMRRISCGC